MTAMQRAECRHFKWKIDECLYEAGVVTVAIRDPEVSKDIEQFYKMEGFEVKTSEDPLSALKSFTVQPKPPVQF